MTAQVIDTELGAGPGAGLHPVREVAACVGRIGAALDGLPTGALPADGTPVEGLIGDVVECERRLAELRLRLARVAEEQAEAAKVAASGTDAWLAHLTGTTRAQSAGGLWLSRMLAQHYPSVRTAFARGELSEDQARIIVRAAEKIPTTITEHDRHTAVTSLVDRAVEERLEPGRLRRVARRMLDVVSRDAADTHQQTLLAAEEDRATAHTWLSLDDNGDGTWTGRFLLTDLHAHLLRTVLEHLTSPRRLTRTRAGDAVLDESAPTGLGRHDLLGIALAELIEHLPTDGWASHGRVGATVMVHLDHARLLDGLAAAGLDSGAEISAGQARRLACNAGIIPAVLGTRSVPLDLGRETRLFTKAQAAALSARHDTCAAEGCRRPFAWCELHHTDPWSTGGPTDLANAAPLCGWHHRRAHDPAYHHTIRPDGTWRFRRGRTDHPTLTDHAASPYITVIPADPTRIPSQKRTPARC